MSTSPIVTDQLHKHNTQAPVATPAAPEAKVRVPLPEPKVWASVDLPSLDLFDPVGTSITMPLIANALSAPPLKNAEPVPTPIASSLLQDAPMDSGLDARMAQLRATSSTLRRDAENVRKTTGTLK